MSRVTWALTLHELVERLRDRWVVVVSALFTLLAAVVTLYGRKVEGGDAVQLTGASLVTLASLLVPLVALVLGHDAIVGERERNTLGLLLSLPVRRAEVTLAKFVGRLAALVFAVSLGLGIAALLAPAGHRSTLLSLMLPSILLGASFLSIGLLVSSVAQRQVTATSLVVAIWFLLVICYDLGLLGLLVASDGAISQSAIGTLVIANPVGLYRLLLLQSFGGARALQDIGVVVPAPTSWAAILLWGSWIVIPAAISGLMLSLGKVHR